MAESNEEKLQRLLQEALDIAEQYKESNTSLVLENEQLLKLNDSYKQLYSIALNGLTQCVEILKWAESSKDVPLSTKCHLEGFRANLTLQLVEQFNNVRK